MSGQGTRLAISAAALVFAAFGAHVLMGGPYEMRTVGAMALRSAIWIGIAGLARRLGLAGEVD